MPLANAATCCCIQSLCSLKPGFHRATLSGRRVTKCGRGICLVSFPPTQLVCLLWFSSHAEKHERTGSIKTACSPTSPAYQMHGPGWWSRRVINHAPSTGRVCSSRRMGNEFGNWLPRLRRHSSDGERLDGGGPEFWGVAWAIYSRGRILKTCLPWPSGWSAKS